MKKLLFAFALMLSVSACSTQRFVLDPNVPEHPTYSGISHFWFWGLFQTDRINPEMHCGTNGIAALETKDSYLSILGIIWAPRPYKIYCKDPSRSYTPRHDQTYRGYDAYGAY
ncbi:MAG: Bor family protein [Alphaproteobacteria bacterium]|nr:Bor family protein [Alphaproteobacteria bacterium]